MYLLLSYVFKGPLINSLSALRYPIPSEIQVDVTLHRNSNEMIITNCREVDQEFRVRIHKIELLLPTFILNPKYQLDIDQR